MSANPNIRCVLELYQENGSGNAEQVATARVTPDWEPACECARFEALRLRSQAVEELGTEDVSIEPVWHPDLGAPYVDEFRAVVRDATGREAVCSIPSAYFTPLARQAAAALGETSENGAAKDKSCRFLVTAYPLDEPAGKRDNGRGPVVEAVAQTIRFREQPLAALLAATEACGEIDPADVPVLIPCGVIDEATALTEQAGAVETGGILVGHLNRDTESRGVFLEVTAQIPARHTRQEETSLTFTPDTWADVDAALALRGLGEIPLGWWHSHPARQWCSRCPEENRRVCKLSGEFFSSHDQALHRAVFPRAYSIALVISDSYAYGLTTPLFGWRRGMVEQRGFHILKGGPT